ncbi:MAG: hypothetical protein SPF92_06090 [Clostridia bacterium]|nr:hypothetical protein [Clostridia bacterium]
MKKIFILLFVLLMLSPAVYAEKSELSVSVPETFLSIQDFGKAYITVSVTNKSDDAAEYDLSYEILNYENWGGEHKMGSLKVGGCSTETINVISDFPKGAYEVQVTATNGDEKYTSSVKMAVMEPSKPQFMDEYTRIGVHTSLAVADVTATNLETTRKNAYNAVKMTETLGFMCVRYGQAIMWRYLESDDGEIKDYIVPMDYLNNIRAQSFLGVQPYRPSNGAGGEHGQTSKTPEQIKSNIDYMLKRLRNDYPKIKFFAEFGNEPDLDKYFPGTDKYGIMYLDLLRHISLALNDETDDFALVGGVTSGGNNAVPLLEYIFQQDAYKYLDGFSYHPYIKAATVDARYDTFTKGYEDSANGNGGWLQKKITEIGWDAKWEADESNRSHYARSDDVTKLYLKTFLHDIDTTIYYASVSTGLGLQLGSNDFEVATPTSIVAANCTKMLNSAQYVGEYPLCENSQCAVFIRDGKPFLAAWIPGEETYTMKFNTPVTVEDMYGNIIEKDVTEVVINSAVKYIYGFGMDLVYDTAYSVKEKSIDKLSAQYEGKFDASVFDKIKAISSDDIAKDSYDALVTYYNVGDRLIDDFANGKTSFELKELSEFLSDWNKQGEKLANVYGISYGDKNLPVSEKYNEVKNKVKTIKGEEKHSQILFTDKMLEYSRVYYSKAADAKSRDYDVMRAPIANANSFLSERVATWAEEILPFQKVDYTIGILTHALPVTANFYSLDEYVETEYEVYNERSIPIDGEIIVENGEGRQMGESIPIELEANGYTKMTLKVYNDKSTKTTDTYKIKIVQNGEILNERWFPITRQLAVKAELMAAEDTFDNLERISVKITNVTPYPVDGKVDITYLPDGWELEKTTENYTVEANETIAVSFNILSKKKVAFNNYVIGVNVCDKDGTEFLNVKKGLNFPFVVRTDKAIDIAAFDGDITDWANAYPLYAGGITDATTKENWRKEDVGSITYMKYDNNYIYVMSTVYDSIYNQRYTGSNSWNGDSIQMYLDPLNNGGTSPQADDYAFYAAYTSNGNEMGIMNVKSTYNAFNENINVLRDNKLGISRYIIKIPFSEVQPLKAGDTFRFNMCFNDSDIEVRHKVVEITDGLKVGGNGRAPSKYYEYVPCDTEKAANTPFEDALVDITMKHALYE